MSPHATYVRFRDTESFSETHVAPPFDERCTRYDVIGEPPVELGAVHVRRTRPEPTPTPTDAATDRGAVGGATRGTAATTLLTGPHPTALRAATRNR